MNETAKKILDGNEAAASVAYRLSETIAIYPITPSSPMAESCDEWSAQGKENLFGTVPSVVQMQSEGGAAGAVHGMLHAGTMTTTFTASQGLLLMIPNMYKIAGELLPFCMHVTARSLATHALSIFGDHSDVMACRQTGFAMLASNSVQEAQDMAAVAHLATLRARVPFMHFFDGFRTSHEINTIVPLSDAQLRELMSCDDVAAFRGRALTPDAPTLRGTAQNPDVFFQAREAINPYYDATPEVVKDMLRRFAEVTGRAYQLFEYVGAPDAEQVVIAMGSGCQTLESAVEHLNAQGRKTGLLKVRLFRPWSLEDFVAALPRSARAIAVLDRTKEPGSVGEPLFQDVVTAIEEARQTGLLPDAFAPCLVGGRYGLGSKEFTPAMAKAVYDELRAARPRRRFTVGINDDVTRLSLTVDAEFDTEAADVFRAVFYGLGSDGTVGANKNTIKIIGGETDAFAQAYFVYDSKKSGAMTVSHLRFGPRPVAAPYLIRSAQFIACHQFSFLEKYDVLEAAAPGSVFLVNATVPADQLWSRLPGDVQRTLIERKIRCYAIDAYQVAREAGMGGRINTIMQTCFFAISGVLPREEAITQIKRAIEKTYSRKGEEVVRKNFAAVDSTLEHLHEVAIPATVTSTLRVGQHIPDEAPEFVRNVTRIMLENKGDLLPVSAFPVDGVWPTATARYEKRAVAQEVPVWDPSVCIQCNKCALVCPHAAIRSRFYPVECVAGAPEGFRSTEFRSRELPGNLFTIQVAPEDCTGCGLCVQVCPAKDKADPRHKAINMEPLLPIRDREVDNYKFFLDLPLPDRTQLGFEVKATQFREPLFEYSGACAGCGETPYIKLITQLYGDRMIVANATGCSSIYGGNLPTTPYTVDACGRGPAWANSLFEDNAEFGLGMRVAIDKKRDNALVLLQRCAPAIGDDLVAALSAADQSNEAGIEAQRARVRELRQRIAGLDSRDARLLRAAADDLVEKVVWIIGGDGWAYDIGYGGLDHVLASGRNVNVLVLDTEVYSNTGGQQSKSTPMGSIAKFAAAGKSGPKKSLGLLAMSYGNIYVAKIAMGARDTQTVQAITEAVSYNGPSLIIAYSHCIAHGFNLAHGMEHQKMAVETGYWPLYRYDPRRAEEGAVPLKMDSRKPKLPLSDFTQLEARYRMLQLQDPERAKELSRIAQEHVTKHYTWYDTLASLNPGSAAAE